METRACRPWLEAEIRLVKPELVVLLGATAAKSLMGSGFSVLEHRGTLLDSDWGAVLPTVHPASVLRAGDEAGRRAARKEFFADIAMARRVFGSR